MQIPLSSHCFTQSFNSRVVDGFQQNEASEKDRAICDAMTLWELIKDCFNDYQHYAALSCLFDLAQLQRLSWQQEWSVGERRQIIANMDAMVSRLRKVLDCRFKVRLMIEVDVIWVDIVHENTTALSPRESVGLADPVANLFRFSIIDDQNVKNVWKCMYHELIKNDRKFSAYSPCLNLINSLVDFIHEGVAEEILGALLEFFSADDSREKIAAFCLLRRADWAVDGRFRFDWKTHLVNINNGLTRVETRYYFDGAAIGEVIEFNWAEPIDQCLPLQTLEGARGDTDATEDLDLQRRGPSSEELVAYSPRFDYDRFFENESVDDADDQVLYRSDSENFDHFGTSANGQFDFSPAASDSGFKSPPDVETARFNRADLTLKAIRQRLTGRSNSRWSDDET